MGARSESGVEDDGSPPAAATQRALLTARAAANDTCQRNRAIAWAAGWACRFCDVSSPAREGPLEANRMWLSQRGSVLLATIGILAAATLPAHAQSEWTGAVSSTWFLSGNWLGGIPAQTRDAIIDTVTRNSTVISTPGAQAASLQVGLSGMGMLTIQTGGTLTSFSLAPIGNFAGSQGTVTVTGAGSNLQFNGSVVVGGQGTGTFTIEDGGTASSAGASIGQSVGSNGTVTVTGAGSNWTNGPSGGLNIGGFGMGTLTIANGGQVINFTTNTAANIGNGAASQGAVTVTGAGSLWSNRFGLTIGNSGTGSLTIADSGLVSSIVPVVIAANASAIGTLNIGAAAGGPATAPGTLMTPIVGFGAGTGTINFNHTSTNYLFAPTISGNGTVNVLAGTTTLTGANIYSGATNIIAGVLQAGGLSTFSPNSPVTVASGGTFNANGFSQTVPAVINAGLVTLGASTTPGAVLTTTSFTGAGGTIAVNTVLGSDASLSDKLVINGGSASGNSFLRITNAGGPGGETVANGIPVVQAINGGSTAPTAFQLANIVEAGPFDYRLFRGSIDASARNDWFLRSDFVVPPTGGITPPSTELPSPEPLPPDPSPDPLPPGVYPIIGPRLATYGVVQPIARQMGLTSLGTLHERIGDTLTVANAGAEGWLRSSWGRVVGQQIDNHYQAFADPRASGRLVGLQFGVDVWRGSFQPGHRDVAGLYFGYLNSNMSVDGLVTNTAATAYVLQRTGTLNLNSYSLGGYWTHYGPGGWYLDTVLQGTRYGGDATTQFSTLGLTTTLPTQGSGFISSVEGGYPIPLAFGPGFVLEPQAQIMWQHVDFDSASDEIATIALGSTSGVTGRLGVRGQWSIPGADGELWQPYGRFNVWRDWGGNAATSFAGSGIAVPLVEQATRLELAAGLTFRLRANLSFYAQAGYQFALAPTNASRDGIKGDVGLRFSW